MSDGDRTCFQFFDCIFKAQFITQADRVSKEKSRGEKIEQRQKFGQIQPPGLMKMSTKSKENSSSLEILKERSLPVLRLGFSFNVKLEKQVSFD